MKESIFEKSLKEREKEQESIKSALGLESKVYPDRISISLPSDCKEKLLKHCKKNYMSPSAQIRCWISQYCDD